METAAVKENKAKTAKAETKDDNSLKGYDYFVAAIKEYIENKCTEDPKFKEKTEIEGKTIEDCSKYIIEQVRESGRCGFSNDEIYGLAVHYFDEPELRSKGYLPHGRIVVNRTIELTPEEKAEIDKKAREEAKSAQKEELKKHYINEYMKTHPLSDEDKAKYEDEAKKKIEDEAKMKADIEERKKASRREAAEKKKEEEAKKKAEEMKKREGETLSLFDFEDDPQGPAINEEQMEKDYDPSEDDGLPFDDASEDAEKENDSKTENNVQEGKNDAGEDEDIDVDSIELGF